MTDETQSTLRARLSTLFETERERNWGRTFAVVVWYLFVTALWVIGLTLLFLATGWPRLAFYPAAVVGAVALVQLATSGARETDGSGHGRTDARTENRD